MEACSATRLFILLCISCVCSAVNYLPNTVLSGYDVCVWKTLNQFQCASLCVKADICLSVNFHPVSGECELNEQTIDEDHPGTPTSGYIYIAPNKSEEALSCGGLCLRDELCIHLDSEKTACLPVDEGEDGTSTFATGGDGTSTSETGGDGTSTFAADGDGTSTFATGWDGTSNFPTGGDGTSTFAAGGDGISTSETGGDGTSTFAAGGDGTSNFPTGGDGISTSETGGDGTSTFAADGDGTSTFATGGDGTSNFPTGGDGTSTFTPGGDGTSTFAAGGDGTSTFAAVSSAPVDVTQTAPKVKYGDGTSTFATGGDGTSTFTPDVATTETTTHAQEIKLEAEHIAVYEGRLTWSQANLFCHKKRQIIVSMKNKRKLKTFTKNLPERFQDTNIKPFIWIGLRRDEGIYRWSDCSPLGSWTYWNETVDPEKSTDDCVRINGQNLEWFPADCNSQNYFACERELESCWFKRYRNAALDPLPEMQLSKTSEDECRYSCLDQLIQGKECIAYTYMETDCFLLMGSDLIVDPPKGTCKTGSTTGVKKCFRYTSEPDQAAEPYDESPMCKNTMDSPGSFTINGTFKHPACL